MAIQQPIPAVHDQTQHRPHPASNISPTQNEALKIHNQTRDEVSNSTSVHRPALIWDSHLAAAAEEWAHHLASRDSGLQHSTAAERPGQGENLYWTSAGGTLADGSQCWVDEGKMYHGEKI